MQLKIAPLTLASPHLNINWRTRDPIFFWAYCSRNGLIFSKSYLVLSSRSSSGMARRSCITGSCWIAEGLDTLGFYYFTISFVLLGCCCLDILILKYMINFHYLKKKKEILYGFSEIKIMKFQNNPKNIRKHTS